MMASQGICVQALNPMTGKMEWKIQPEDYDYQQELARAAFADMLHDTERNQLYYEGLKAAISLKRKLGEPVHVLDIGTGTGLLSMMAAKLGADSITAIEEFRPMANCAEKIIAQNGFADQIKLVRKRSTGVKVGPGLDMERRANILVTEVFDTELIGEGAIGTFNHAHDELLTEDCLVVPHSGRVYAQVVSSELCSKWNGLHDIKVDSSKTLVIPDDQRGHGASSLALHDLQLTQMSEASGHFKALSEPIPIFDFDFGRLEKKAIPLSRQSSHTFKPQALGKCDAIFMWWDIKMDPDSEVILSCAPFWAHPDRELFESKAKKQPWRDHWMQAIYYPINSPNITKETSALTLTSNHDEYSFWFDLTDKPTEQIPQIPMPSPKSGIHLAVSRTRLGLLNEENSIKTMSNAVAKMMLGRQSPNILVLSEQSLLPLIASSYAKELNGKVLCFELNRHFREAMLAIGQANALSGTLEVRHDIESIEEISKDVLPFSKIDCIIAEPNFSISLLPWHNLFYWYMLRKIGLDAAHIAIFPLKATIWAVPVEFEHLWKIRSPLGKVEGFDMQHFDDIIMSACDISDAEVEPQPLWEYPCCAKALPKSLATFEMSQDIPLQRLVKTVSFDHLSMKKHCSGVAFWMDWTLNDSDVLSSGPVKNIEVNEKIEWTPHAKQGVHFFVESSHEIMLDIIHVRLTFDPKEGAISFQFD